MRHAVLYVVAIVLLAAVPVRAEWCATRSGSLVSACADSRDTYGPSWAQPPLTSSELLAYGATNGCKIGTSSAGVGIVVECAAGYSGGCFTDEPACQRFRDTLRVAGRNDG